MANEENLKKRVPFKKNDPRINREGRPKKIPALDVLLADLLDDDEESAKMILAALIEKAKEGDVRAAQVILDRAYGKPKESIDLTSKGESITPQRIFFKDTDGSTRDEYGNKLEVPPAVE